METTFKYQGKIITTPNLEKKLKRMRISIDDIEIIDTIKKEKIVENGVEDYMLNKQQVIVRSTEDNIRRVCYIDKDKPLPSIKELFKKQGIYSDEFLMTMYYDEGTL